MHWLTTGQLVSLPRLVLLEADPLEGASVAVAKDEATGGLRLYQARAHESDAGQLRVHLEAAALVV